ncbi:translation initiation factor IF-2, partial [Leptospira terpstrae]
MEEQKSIKETLQQGASGDKTKKKLVIKKKAAPADEKKESSSGSQAAEAIKTSSPSSDKKKDLNELIREEAKRQGLGSGPQAPSQASPIVSRPERKPEPQPERERPPMDRKPESILSGDTSSPNYRQGGGPGQGQGGGNQGYFRKEDRNPIVSRPTTPRPPRPEGQGTGYQGNRGPGQGGPGGYQGNRGPGQGGPGGYQGNRGP